MTGAFSRRARVSCGMALFLTLLLLHAGCVTVYSGNNSPTPAVPASSGGNATANATGGLAGNATGPIPGSILTATPTPPTRYQPLVVKAVGKRPAEEETFTFRHASQDYSVTLPVNATLLRAANDSGNHEAAPGDGDLLLYYQEMIADPAMDEFYNETGRRLEKLRYRQGNQMSEDDYLELVVSFVQQIPTKEAVRAPHYPVEVIADRSGTAAEKSILLAGLLAHQGYDTAVLIFPEKSNVAAGMHIQLATKPSFRVFSDGRRDYIYLDAATTRLIGMYPDGYKTVQEPLIVRVGSGTMTYGKMRSVADLMYDIATMKTSIETIREKQQAGTAMDWDEEALSSYEETIEFVESTNDRIKAIEAVRESELPHHSSCMTCV